MSKVQGAADILQHTLMNTDGTHCCLMQESPRGLKRSQVAVKCGSDGCPTSAYSPDFADPAAAAWDEA